MRRSGRMPRTNAELDREYTEILGIYREWIMSQFVGVLRFCDAKTTKAGKPFKQLTFDGYSGKVFDWDNGEYTLGLPYEVEVEDGQFPKLKSAKLVETNEQIPPPTVAAFSRFGKLPAPDSHGRAAAVMTDQLRVAKSAALSNLTANAVQAGNWIPPDKLKEWSQCWNAAVMGCPWPGEDVQPDPEPESGEIPF